MSEYEIVIDDYRVAEPAVGFLDIEELVKTNLPPLPGSATKIMGMLEDDNVTSSQLAEVIGYDVALSSRVMRLANSPMYALLRSVSSIPAAVAAVGLRSISDMVMLGVASDSFSNEMRSIKTGVSIWEHSVAVALTCRSISKELGMRGTDEAFTCGLLHDIGKNLLFQADSASFLKTEEATNEDDASELESRMFGYTHTEVGFFVARRWGLSDEVCSTIRWHHEPVNSNQAVAIAHIVNVADDLATRKGFGLYFGTPDELPDSFSVETLRLTESQIENAWAVTESSLHEILESC